MKRIFAVLGVLASFAVSSAYGASAVEPYVLDSSGDVVKSGFGECVRTGYWTPSLALKSKHVMTCDKHLVKKEVKPAPMKKVLAEQTFVTFEFDSVAMTNEGTANLVAFMNRVDAKKVDTVMLSGYADPIGKAVYNLELSHRRNLEIAKIMKANGYKEEQIITNAFGETDAMAACVDEKKGKRKALIKCYTPNRRVVISVKYKN